MLQVSESIAAPAINVRTVGSSGIRSLISSGPSSTNANHVRGCDTRECRSDWVDQANSSAKSSTVTSDCPRQPVNSTRLRIECAFAMATSATAATGAPSNMPSQSAIATTLTFRRGSGEICRRLPSAFISRSVDRPTNPLRRKAAATTPSHMEYAVVDAIKCAAVLAPAANWSAKR